MTAINEIFSKLFDHRPFLQNEIINFKKEFETKRGDREIDNLFQTLEYTTEIKQGHISKVIEACDANLPRTIADIQVAFRMCDETLKLETSCQNKSAIERKDAERAKRLKVAQETYDLKLKAIDEKFDAKEAQIQEQYFNLEKDIIDFL